MLQHLGMERRDGRGGDGRGREMGGPQPGCSWVGNGTSTITASVMAQDTQAELFCLGAGLWGLHMSQS